MLAFEKARGGGHGGFVERPGIVERTAVIEWRENAASIDAVAIGLSLGQPTRVKIMADFFAGDDTNRGWKKGVEGALKFFRREKRSCFEMRSLAEGVDASVGATGAMYDDSFLRDFASGSVECALNCRETRLKLPAVEVGSVVGDREFDISHLFGTTRLNLHHEASGVKTLEELQRLKAGLKPRPSHLFRQVL